MATETSGSPERDLPVAAGAVGGVAAFLLGYVLTFLTKAGDTSDPLGDLGGSLGGADIAPAGWQVIGWFFFQAHNVGIEASVSVGDGGSQQLPSDIGVVLLLVPVVSLAVAGAIVASQADAGDAVGGVVAGASVAVGYLVLAVVFALVTPWTVSAAGASATVGPTLITAVLLAGVVYPVVFGAVGGAVAGVLGG
jgi:hypothetical protein